MECGPHHLLGPLDDLNGIVLHPARALQELAVLELVTGHFVAFVVENHEAGARSPLVDGSDELWHRARVIGQGYAPLEAMADALSALSPERRVSDLEKLSGKQFDILVVGGGVTGAGVALDAATRGLSVALVEAQDWAAGTSSRSSKLIHGGLRYLQMLDFHLVHEALRERSLLLGSLAPHLVRPVPILYPLRRPFVERAYVGAGIALYDLLAFSTATGFGRRGNLPWHRHLSKRRALELVPGLRRDTLAGAVLYYDGQVDDARFVVELVRTAASHGALALTRVPVVAFLRQGGRVAGATVRDNETGQSHDVRAKVTICATGPWTEETEALAGRERAVTVRPSKGAHILVPRERLDAGCGLILRTEKSVLFVLPWRDSHWIVGTTDTDWPYAKGRPLATSSDVSYILDELNSVLEHPLRKDDVVGIYAGLRPLVAGRGVVRGPGEERQAATDNPAKSRAGERGAGEGGAGEGEETTELSREHAVGRPAPGLVVVSGGKYTTYRVMAADAVDAAVDDAGLHALGCRTARVPLLGARGLPQASDRLESLASELGFPLPPATMEHLLGRYGSLALEVLGPLETAPSLSAPLEGGGGYLRAEVTYAVSCEGARHVDDVLSRRTRLAIESPDRGMSCAREVGELMAGLLGWDQAALEAELHAYEREAELWTRAAREAHDDAEASRMAEAVPALLPVP